ncbi:phage tail protein [Photobacterium chitinilyticum]|uniref:Phage tail protein n=1 Tax=Photobacterium chitinilyticum TaxID=2485123 RepID=A0A444JSB8_9GAMM|nr:tail fiber protein [Photobacterium chitinilyticum]RWX55966.1 phage tail protein [Photobacterium chitinilyticum]
MDSFLGFVHPSAFNFAPVNYAFCAGQIITISDNQALYSLLGSTYGGDGRSTMGLPDLRGRTPIGFGSPSLPTLNPVAWGELGGRQYTSLSVAQMPTHSHVASFTPIGGGSSSGTLAVSTSDGNQDAATGNYFANGKQGFNSVKGFVASADAGTTVDVGGLNVSGSEGGGAVEVGTTGSSTPIDIRNPYLGLNYVISMKGIYPPRN